MITPAYGLTATERVLPNFVLDWTTGLVQSTVDVTRASVATFTGSNGLIQSAAENTQRVDYSTGVAGLLVEESRQNFLPNSEDISAWTLSANSDVLTNQTLSPSGEQNADKLFQNSTASSAYVAAQLLTSVLPTQNCVGSVYAKADGLTNLLIRIFDPVPTGGNYIWANFNLSNGTVNGSGVVGNASNIAVNIQPAANGFYRCILSGTPNTSGDSVNVVIYLVTNTGNSAVSAGVVGRGLFLWGAQLEAGAFPTSYIPTEASAVTRNADVATVTGTNFSDFWNPTIGALYVEASTYTTVSTDRRIAIVNDGTNNNQLGYHFGAVGSILTSAVAVSGSFQYGPNEGAYQANTVYKRALAYAAGNIRSATNGVLAAGSSAGALVPTVNKLDIGNRNGAQFMAGHIRKIMYYPQRLLDAEIRAITS